MKTFAVSENIVMYAFRYALGRRTGAVLDVVEMLRQHWSELERFTQDQIRHEIEVAISTDCAGAECDVNNWQALLEDTK